MKLNKEQILDDYRMTIHRFTLTEYKKNARDVYLSHLVSNYSPKQYKKIGRMLGEEFKNSYPNNYEISLFTLEIIASLLFLANEFEAFNKLTSQVKVDNNLLRLLKNGIKAVDYGITNIKDFRECFTKVEDMHLEEEQYLAN